MIESLVRLALNQRIVVVVVAAALLVAGVQASRRLSVDAFPDVTNVQVQIASEAHGRSPEEVERLVTVPIEIAMTGLPSLVQMRSLNKPGLSLITLVFEDATSVWFARQLVLERLIEVSERMPRGVAPVLGPVSSGLGEVYQYTLDHAGDGDRALSEDELMRRRVVQDWVVRPLLRSIPGVAEINSQGGYVRQYQVRVDPERMRHYGVSLAHVARALERNNANAGAGVLRRDAEQYLIRGVGVIRDIADIERTVLREHGGTPVVLRDIAEVRIGHEVRQGALVKNGTTEAVGGVVMMIQGGNAKEVVARVKAKVAEINADGRLPDGLRIVPYYDRSDLVDAALWTVTKVLIEGVVLVIVVLALFLGDLRSSLIVVATLVLTPLLTFIAMNRFGISANLMSLGGLAIAIGLMVDGSVVVVENVYARLAQQRPAPEARTAVVLAAVREVGVPVIFGVGVIVLVFLPLMTFQGMEGKMFAPLAWTIAIALTASLVLSLTLSPALSAMLLRPHGGDHDTRLVRALKAPYLRLLRRALAHPRATAAAALVAFLAAAAVVPLLGTSFIPEMKEGSIVPGINRVPNISLEESIELEMEAMRMAMRVPGVKTAVSSVGRGESPADPQAQNESTPIVALEPRGAWPAGWTQDDIADEIRRRFRAIPSADVVMAQPISDRVDELVTGVRADVAVKVFGDELGPMRETAQRIARIARTVSGVQDVLVERSAGQQYLTIDIDRESIARYGLNVQDVHDVLETAIAGRKVTDVYEGERRFAAVVRYEKTARDSIEAVRELRITGDSGEQLRLADLARVEVREGPAQISREQAKRRIVVAINVRDRDLGGFVAELQRAVQAQVALPPGTWLEWGGQFENMERALGHLSLIVPVTIAAIFFLLFLLFGALRWAALIILVLPLASIGGVVGLYLSGEYLSVPASVGFIALWGIAVLNGVVLVACIRGLRGEGLAVRDAVLAGAAQRFRPVMMTASVAMLGLVPFLFATGPGSEVQRPLAVVVIGGLVSSTLLTLVLLPVVYEWLDAPRVRSARRNAAPAATGDEAAASQPGGR